MLGNEFKVYITELEDDQGYSGISPVSLGNARQPMFSRDGKSILVNGTAGSFSGLFVTNKRGQGAKLVNDRGDAFWPVWSPNGAEIIFADKNLDNILYRQNSSGAFSDPEFREVQANHTRILAKNPLWSDDNRLLFQGCAGWLNQPGECGIWVSDADHINPERILTNSGLPMDAKNGLLVYMSAEDGDWDIYLAPLSGGRPENITNNPNQDGMAAIAPDGKSVAYVSDESGQWAVWTITLSNHSKKLWFELNNPERGTIDSSNWFEERMSWTK